MKTKIEIDVRTGEGITPNAILDTVKVALMSIGADVISLSASNGIITITESKRGGQNEAK